LIQALYAAALGLVLSVCAGPRDPQRAAWTREWNARLDAAASDFEHPCATKPFIAWADGFLAGCEAAPPEAATPECVARHGWVRERVAQCREWTAWQMRNFGRHERVEGEAPSMRID
jgi:hypothetical protein